MTDSRKQLEEDIIVFLQNRELGHVYSEQIMNYLDRQAAITRAECDVERDRWIQRYKKEKSNADGHWKNANKWAKKCYKWKTKANRYRAKALMLACNSRGYEDDEAILKNCCVHCGYLKTKGEYCDWVLKAVDGE